MPEYLRQPKQLVKYANDIYARGLILDSLIDIKTDRPSGL